MGLVNFGWGTTFPMALFACEVEKFDETRTPSNLLTLCTGETDNVARQKEQS